MKFRLFIQGVYERFDFCDQLGEVVGGNAPDCGVVYGVVAMDDAIAKSDDARKFADLRRGSLVGPMQTAQCFADDFKLALDRAAELAIGLIIRKAPLRTPCVNAATGFQYVKERLRRPIAHKRPAAWPQLRDGEMDCEWVARSANRLAGGTAFPARRRNRDSAGHILR